MYSQIWNYAASFQISTFMYLWAIYIFSRSGHLYKLLTDTGMWEFGNEAAQFNFCKYLWIFVNICEIVRL